MLLLAGSNTALLEGLAQSLARTGSHVIVGPTLSEAEELRAQHHPVLVVVERALLGGGQSSHAFMSGVLASGCALVTYHESGEEAATPALSPGLTRLVLADLELPLERNRLIALAEHAVQRAKTVGRSGPVTQPETPAS